MYTNYLINEIHDSFYMAEKQLDKVMYESIKKTPEQINKALRLKKVGLKNSKEVQVIEEKINYFSSVQSFMYSMSQVFFGTKNISEKQVKDICQKYELEIKPIGDFNGFVPENKLQEIEMFIKKINSIEIIKPIRQFYLGNNMVNPKLGFKNPIQHYHLDNNIESLFKPIDFEKPFSPDSIVSFKSEMITNDNTDISKLMNFLICAPSHNFNKKIDEIYKWNNPELKIEDYLEMQELIHKLKDPIILSPFKHTVYGIFYFIVTAWGDEASDENVVNPINN